MKEHRYHSVKDKCPGHATGSILGHERGSSGGQTGGRLQKTHQDFKERRV